MAQANVRCLTPLEHVDGFAFQLEPNQVNIMALMMLWMVPAATTAGASLDDIAAPAFAAPSPGQIASTDAPADLSALAAGDCHFSRGLPAMSLALLPQTQDQSQRQTEPLPVEPLRKHFGTAGSTYWILNAGLGSDVHSNYLLRTGIGISHFVADDVSLDAELNEMFIAQRGDNAVAINVNLLIRWHIWHDRDYRWTIYADGGAGLALASAKVPADGSQFDFTPQLGMGASFDIGNDRRIYSGVRWHHFSNANLFENNPGRDSLMLYAMLSFPF